MKFTYPIFTVLFIFFASIANAQIFKKEQIWSGNPVLPGDFADPCIVVYKDTVYIYATAANVATVWRSADMVNWKLTKLNWPTSMHQPDVWAPAVTRGVDGKFYLYTSVNHQIYVGVADHPLGPFKNLLGDSALIKDRQYWPQMHTIDADCFVDDDGKAYLYWGSGWDFKDGICAVAPLNKDMASFKAPPKAITPEGYFEGPHMLKHDGKYYLMYSDGVYFNDSYKVRYAIGDKPTGPFIQAENSPILVSDHTKHVSGPGHHFTLKIKEQYYIVYHKHTFPFRNGQRQICIDRLDFDENGLIKKVIPTNTGVPLNFLKHQDKRTRIQPVTVTASTEENKDYIAENAVDNNNGTRWLAPAGKHAFLQVDLGKVKSISAVALVFDEIMGNYNYHVTYSVDGINWLYFATGNNADAEEWPIECRKQVNARHLKITINSSDKGKQAGLWELKIYQ